jgi:hypothetical protein
LGFEVIWWTEQSQQRCPPTTGSDAWEQPPITSLSDFIDRAILAAYDCDEAGSKLQAREDGELIVASIEGLIALGGLAVAECQFAI